MGFKPNEDHGWKVERSVHMQIGENECRRVNGGGDIVSFLEGGKSFEQILLSGINSPLCPPPPR
jgi:hypothetical protein